ncbi:outer membrane protein TOM13 [Plectosphaerella cucumerina]|uniref:Outer membrane protein TOM13 n=1 Tax=Plectosphaerella cucumerina TaxID=40658 RepID=A0A8K0TNY3_9PEZI|nr:outer membrane protein TOM13 [Plectosphaerella cucumerina]
MASDDSFNPLAESGVTIRSDSEQYSQGEDMSGSPQSTDTPVILYKPPTIWSLVRGTAINLLLPFINGMMLGFGELFAHEAAFRLGWGGTKVFPMTRRRAHPIGPGIEIREKSSRPRTSLNDLTSLE